MDKRDILEEAIREITFESLKESDSLFFYDRRQLKKTIQDEEKRVLATLQKLTEEEQRLVRDYLDHVGAMAEFESMSLYSEGAKDCAALMNELGLLGNGVHK